MRKKKSTSTPLTTESVGPIMVDVFMEHIMPSIEGVIDTKINDAKEELREEIALYRADVITFKEEVIGEIKKS